MLIGVSVLLKSERAHVLARSKAGSRGVARLMLAHRVAKHSAAILLIDDDSSLGLALVDLLAAHGHSPRYVPTPEEAYELLLAPHRLEVVILDLNLGSARGDWLIEKLRDSGARIPAIVIHSGQPLTELTRVSKLVRAEAVLQKPCSIERLLEAVELAVG